MKELSDWLEAGGTRRYFYVVFGAFFFTIPTFSIVLPGGIFPLVVYVLCFLEGGAYLFFAPVHLAINGALVAGLAWATAGTIVGAGKSPSARLAMLGVLGAVLLFIGSRAIYTPMNSNIRRSVSLAEVLN